MHKQTVACMGAGFLLVILMGMASVSALNKTPPQLVDIDIATLTATPPHETLTPQSTAALTQLFAERGYEWPPASLNEVPALVVEKLPEDFSTLTDIQQRKTLFMRSLLPIVMLENQRILEQRELVKLMFTQGIPDSGSEHYRWLTQVAREMRVTGDLHYPEVQTRLLRRLDEIPLTLALAQAAIESGWGTSRFALEGNSLFGQWTYKPGKGLVPDDRDPSATHFVRSFPNLRASVRAYMLNLNTSKAYREFRASRANMRADGGVLSAEKLASHLRRYSQRGIDYVQDLHRMIRGRTLTQLVQAPQFQKLDSIAVINNRELPDG